MCYEIELFKELVYEFSLLAAKCIETIVDEFCLEIHPSRAVSKGKIPRKGNFIFNNSSIKFRFHGSGCWFEIDGKELDFDFDEFGKLKGFGVYSLIDFAMSNKQKFRVFNSKDFVSKCLVSLEKAGVISKVNQYFLYKINPDI